MIVNVIVVAIARGGRGGEGVALAGASSVLLGGHGFVFLCCWWEIGDFAELRFQLRNKTKRNIYKRSCSVGKLW